MDFGGKISRLRGDRSPEWVAKQIGCHGLTIRRYESGDQKASAENAYKLGQLFGVSVDWMLDVEQDYPPPATDKQAAAAMVEQALSGAGLAGELTDDQREVLVWWGRLSGEHRNRVLGIMQGFAEAGSAAPDTQFTDEELHILRRTREIMDAHRRRQIAEISDSNAGPADLDSETATPDIAKAVVEGRERERRRRRSARDHG